MTTADPFEIYRALRIVNPSPYMIYLQAHGAILVASSPEILCRCVGGVVTNRPLAGTRPRGTSEDQDAKLDRVMDVERYSHVMHLSSTLTGRLRDGLDCWDALRNTLPVGTVSGAPKVRAMQIIDELEPTRRGPY